jgi:predicted membrane protein
LIHVGKLLVVAGVIIAAVGALMIFGVPFGRLPGDFVYRRGNATFYFPLATSIVLSVILSLLFAFFRR